MGLGPPKTLSNLSSSDFTSNSMMDFLYAVRCWLLYMRAEYLERVQKNKQLGKVFNNILVRNCLKRGHILHEVSCADTQYPGHCFKKKRSGSLTLSELPLSCSDSVTSILLLPGVSLEGVSMG